MASSSMQPESTTIAGSLEITRLITGLWQLAGGHDAEVRVAPAAEAMGSLIEAGLDCFDMADHYGDAELVVGHYHATATRPLTAFTKWCPPEDGVKSSENAEAAVDRALTRMGQKSIALLQYHIWDYSDDTYLYNLSHLSRLQREGKIQHIGLTNTDAAHLELLLHSGYPIATNQVACSVIDRRLVRGRMSTLCSEHNVKILAYGTLLGGFLSEKWLGAEEPRDTLSLNWSLRKYLRFIRAAGGWHAFQRVLQSLAAVASRHKVPIAAVAMRWVLDIPVVGAVIVGSRLSNDSGKYVVSNLLPFSFSLGAQDLAMIEEAQKGLRDIPSDCGDEYRRPPFLTAAGDLSDHLKPPKQLDEVLKAIAEGHRVEYRTGSKWEEIAVSTPREDLKQYAKARAPAHLLVQGYSRAVRYGDVIRVSGTTANVPPGLDIAIPALGGACPRCQTVAALDIIARAVKRLGGQMSDIVRTRVMIRPEVECEPVSAAHGWVFRCEKALPSNTLVITGLIGDGFLVEVEAEAVVGSGGNVLVLNDDASETVGRRYLPE